MMFRDFAGPERPLSWSLQFWPVLVCSFVAALAATWLCKKIALKLGIVDTPDNHVKTHKEPVAYLGGVGILAGLTVGILGGIALLKDMEGFDKSLTWLLGILAGAGIACFVGLVDDLMAQFVAHQTRRAVELHDRFLGKGLGIAGWWAGGQGGRNMQRRCNHDR